MLKSSAASLVWLYSSTTDKLPSPDVSRWSTSACACTACAACVVTGLVRLSAERVRARLAPPHLYYIYGVLSES